MTSNTFSGSGIYVVFALILVLVVLMFASMWKVNVKAGLPGWGAIIPIYNGTLILRMAGRPSWWLVLWFIPLANLVLLRVPFDIARRFGKRYLFGLGLLMLPYVFYPILAFGDSQYQAGDPGDP